MAFLRVSTVVTLIVAIGGVAGLATAAEQEKLQISEKQPFGKYISSDEGRAVYMFTADSKGKSACYDACAKAWPPVLTSSKPMAEAGLNAGMLGVTKRKGGSEQVTYDGMPLYYFAQDQKPGSTAGQGISHFGGEWYLLSPQGKKIDTD